MLTRPFRLDLVPGGVQLMVHVSQYDSDQELVLSLYSSQGTLDVPSDGSVTASIRGTKGDGNGISFACPLTFVGGVPTVTIQLTKQMTAIAGKTPFEIVLWATDINGDVFELPSATFYLIVQPAAMDYETLDSDSDIMELVDCLEKANEIIAAAENIENAVETLQNMQEEISELNSLTRDVENLKSQVASLKQLVQQLSKDIEKAAKMDLTDVWDSINSLTDDVEKLQGSLSTKVDDGRVDNGYLYLLADGNVVAGPFACSGGGGGGGGGSSSDSSLTVTNTTGWTASTVVSGANCNLSIRWSSTEDGINTGPGTLKVQVNNVTKASMSIEQGDVTVNVGSYLSVGDNAISLVISDSTGNSKTRTFSVTVISLYLTSAFSGTTIQTGVVTFPYIPYGSISKTVYFVLDDITLGTVTTTATGKQLTYAIPAQTHGAHTLEVYMTATVNGSVVTSESLFYDVIWVESSEDAPIIAIQTGMKSVAQYTTVNIPYQVYTPGSSTSAVTISVNGTQVSSLTVDRTQHVFSYRMDQEGTVRITISTGNVSKSLTLTVTPVSIDVEAETDSLVLYLSSASRSNSEANPAVWEDAENGISCTFSGFNWTSDGWIQDKDGVVAMKVTGDGRLTIPYRMFASDFRSTGRTIEIDFSSEDVLDYDAVILSCEYGGRGLTITPQNCRLASEQSSISMQYKEDEHVRVSFVIEKSSGLRRMYAYVDGIQSGVIQYAANDDFEQTSPVYITVGSNQATINLYTIRVYENDLTADQMVDNWIADTQVGELMLERYARNNILDSYGSIITSKLPSDLPYMILEAEELPQYKGDKKTISGTYVDPTSPSRSFTFTGCQIDVQGTSSQYYKRKNYKMKFKQGFIMTGSGEVASVFQLTDESVATNVFCMKADVASSEGANNVELVRLYCKICPYKTPAQEENELVRQGIDGYPIVIFWYDTVNQTTTFLGKYNFNNDKSTEEVFGFEEGDESWEIRNNTSDRALWKSADYTSTTTDKDGKTIFEWENDFEARYPEENMDIAQLQEFSEWIVSTDPEQATDEALNNAVTYDDVLYTSDTAAYRRAKFKAEISDYVELDSALFYYLFTELFLMVDSRAKNMFPSFMGAAIEEAAE